MDEYVIINAAADRAVTAEITAAANREFLSLDELIGSISSG